MILFKMKFPEEMQDIKPVSSYSDLPTGRAAKTELVARKLSATNKSLVQTRDLFFFLPPRTLRKPSSYSKLEWRKEKSIIASKVFSKQEFQELKFIVSLPSLRFFYFEKLFTLFSKDKTPFVVITNYEMCLLAERCKRDCRM